MQFNLNNFILCYKIRSVNEEFSDLKLRNPQNSSDQDDLIDLLYLNEPAILHCLQERYFHNCIYTYTGPILIAVNPFQQMNIYSSKILQEYYNYGLIKSHGVDVVKKLSPHVYAIADNSYRKMMNSLLNVHVSQKRNPQTTEICNQSILISGESGAGIFKLYYINQLFWCYILPNLL